MRQGIVVVLFIILMGITGVALTAGAEMTFQQTKENAEQGDAKAQLNLGKSYVVKKVDLSNSSQRIAASVINEGKSSIAIFSTAPKEEGVFVIVEIELPVDNSKLQLHPKDIYLIQADGSKLFGFIDDNGLWMNVNDLKEDSSVTYYSTGRSVTMRRMFLMRRTDVESSVLTYKGEENTPLKPYIKK